MKKIKYVSSWSMASLLYLACSATVSANDSDDLDPFADAAVTYAQQYYVSEKEAARRLRLMAHASDAADALSERLGDSIGGVYFDHTGNKLTMVVKTTLDWVPGPKKVKFNDRFHTPDDGKGNKGNNSSRVLNLPVRFETGAPLNRSAIEDIVDNKTSSLLTLIPGLQGFGYDPKTDRLFLNIHGVDENEINDILDAESLWDIDGLQLDVRMMENPIEPSAVRGGARLSIATAGGTRTCTSGFVGTDANGDDGILTASHCAPGDFTYIGNDGVVHSLTVSSVSTSANHDLMFLTGSAAFPAEFFPNSSTTTRPVTGTRFRSSTNTNGWFSSGSFICHNGINSGMSCGEVDSIKYKPTYANGCGTSSCNSVFVTVKGPNLQCAKGDSGGPWYASFTAFGIHSADDSSPTNPGPCSIAIYSSVDYASELGVSIKF